MLSVVSLLLLLVFGAANASHLRNGSATFSVPDEKGYVSWIRKMGSFRHEVSDKVKNKVKPCLTIKVNKKGSGGFVSVQKAIDSLPDSNRCRVLIMVGKGIYREKVSIPNTKAYITILGAAANKTIIEWDDTAERMGRNGHPMGTYGSATFSVDSPYFIARHIQFKNSAPSPPSGALGKQAVALRISGDMAAFIDCKFIGAQDTLYDHMGRHYFKRCYIQGSVDFIFGNGLSFYESCHLHAITTRFGALTAQSRESFLEQTGFSFFNCRVTGSGALYLGRAWGTFSRVVFAYTYMDKIIIPKGWNDWGDKNRDMTVFYGQYRCSGPGADFGGRVSWSRELTKKEAEPFTTINFIDGQKWLRNT